MDQYDLFKFGMQLHRADSLTPARLAAAASFRVELLRQLVEHCESMIDSYRRGDRGGRDFDEASILLPCAQSAMVTALDRL